MCLDWTRKRIEKPTTRIVWAWKFFRCTPDALPRPEFSWHGRGQKGWPLNKWIKAKKPWGDSRAKRYGFHAMRQKSSRHPTRVKLRRVIELGSHNCCPALIALEMLIPRSSWKKQTGSK